MLILKLKPHQLQDVQNLLGGVYAPLTGFLDEKDFTSVLKKMRLRSGAIWPIPVTLDVSGETAREIQGQTEITLANQANRSVARLRNPEVYKYHRDNLAEKVYGTTDKNHPGVASVYKQEDYFIGGKVDALQDSTPRSYPTHNLTPHETRKKFKKLGWQTVVAFQTRNVPHRGHEFLQKQALKEADGLFIQPVVGEKKLADFKDEYILGAYEILIERYFPRGKVLLGALPLRMRYVGPREALLHALIRKNYGCTHFIVGRDHAGVGKYYSPTAAQEIFEQFDAGELGVEILKFPEVVYSPSRKKHFFVHEVEKEDYEKFSGSKIRKMIQHKQKPPEHLMRPEVYNLLTNSRNSLVDKVYKENSNHNQKGFVLWLTGLSQSGKSTTADMVYEKLLERGMRVERLDGDVVREALTKDLGFTKEDRDENIRRVGFVAKLLSQNGVAVVASFISPYQKHRDELREQIKNFIEVYVSTPLEVCEARDSKGLYAKARVGEIQNFTGIDDPYEEPENPHLVIEPHNFSVEECASQIITHLKEGGYLG